MSKNTIKIDLIKLDGGTQSRSKIDKKIVEEYAKEMNEGAVFPPITLFYDGETYWLGDGFHRVRGALYIGRDEIEAEVRQGDKRAAILHSVGANAIHGLRRTNADKRRAVTTMLEDDEWTNLPDREIARRCVVGNKFVSNMRKEIDVYRTHLQDDATRIGRLRNNVSLSEWDTLSDDDKSILLDPKEGSSAFFNRQDGDAIEWAQWSWNPITGCLHNCPYCYARDIANQAKMQKYYPNGFAPSFRSNAINSPAAVRVPSMAEKDARYRNVFTCSMADLFGNWVPVEWINAVMQSMAKNPQWNFLMLTKFPQRLPEVDIPANAWMGTTVDKQSRVANAERAFSGVKCGIKWLSVEPLLEPLTFSNVAIFDWVVIGGASASRNTPSWVPPYRWVESIVRQCDEAGVPVYFKSNLGIANRVLELPFDAPITQDPQVAPDEFSYKGNQ